MPERYAREFRRTICERLVAGERISKVSNETGVSEATLHRWRDQALIDADLKPGTKSVEVDELAQARRTIEELEAELAAVKAASGAGHPMEVVGVIGGDRSELVASELGTAFVMRRLLGVTRAACERFEGEERPGRPQQRDGLAS